MTRFRDVIEFVLSVASVLKMRFTFCFSVRDDSFSKIDNRIPNYKYISISTFILQLTNSTG